MKRKTKKWIKKHFNLYNLSIIGLIIIIIISLCVIFRENIGNVANSIASNIKELRETDSSSEEKELNGVKVVASTVKQDEEISEEKAKKMAVKQFKRLGEKVKEDELNVTPIRRSGERYYYITTQKNTLEIRILGGEITRINSEIVE